MVVHLNMRVCSLALMQIFLLIALKSCVIIAGYYCNIDITQPLIELVHFSALE
jgi:hypothetical protein